MNEAAVLAMYAGTVGVVLPRFLQRSDWPHRAPRLAIGLWSGLLLSFTAAFALLVHHLAAPRRLLHHGALRFLHSCTDSDAVLYSGPGSDTVQMVAPLLVAGWPLLWSATALGRARFRRRAHAGLLDLVARPLEQLGAVVVEYATPAAYCLPGREHRIVVTRGAIAELTPAELHAVLAHERAHIKGRHHLITGILRAFRMAFPGLPLARAAHDHSTVLLEMAADDRALRGRNPRDLASAMCKMAVGRVPYGGLAAGKTDVVHRAERVLCPPPDPSRLALAGAALVIFAIPVFPILFACRPA